MRLIDFIKDVMPTGPNILDPEEQNNDRFIEAITDHLDRDKPLADLPIDTYVGKCCVSALIAYSRLSLTVDTHHGVQEPLAVSCFVAMQIWLYG